jgi:glycogen phosphorylase
MIEDLKPFTCRYLPDELNPLNELALDVRWTWNHGSDQLWRSIDPDTWEIIRNPWWMLQSISQEKLDSVIADPEFRKELSRMEKFHREYLGAPGWYEQNFAGNRLGMVAYFSMEFGLGEAIPLYAGGLGILAGDYLKTASDLNIPLVGVGLLYQHGYFRQMLDDQGRQIQANPPNDPISLPMKPVTDPQGGWLRVPLELPGRVLTLRTWQVQVGRTNLYLLDSNDLMNDAADRSIISRLYDDQPEFRLIQEMILGIGGWRLLNLLGLQPDVCHTNEGHAAFSILERARDFMKKNEVTFPVALWATRAGNVFTTHTAVAAGFDTYPRELIERYFKGYAASLGISLNQLLAIGRTNPSGAQDRFNMAVLAMRGSSCINGVSRLHGSVSRRLFQPVFPRWPEIEVPVEHITNGVHMPSWDSQKADEYWTRNAGKGCWYEGLENVTSDMQQMSNDQLWSLRTWARQELVGNVRRRLERQFRELAAGPEVIRQVKNVLDPDVLTIGFARRFATYKRPNLLLHDRERLLKILNNPDRPAQLVVAGKAHPQDEEGKRLVQEMVLFSRLPEARRRVVFLPDYDIELGQELVQGMDLWINTPRRPWEACGTSGMKVLVNGGLNLSELDGWWAEAYQPDLGWAIGDGQEHGPEWDAMEAERLYDLLENEIIPEYYERNKKGIPLKWVRRIRKNICYLAPEFSSNRMLRQYLEEVYHPAADRFKSRAADKAQTAKELDRWQKTLENAWDRIRFGRSVIGRQDDRWQIECEIFTGDIPPESLSVEAYADPVDGFKHLRKSLELVRKITSRSEPCYLYRGVVQAVRPAEHYSLRLIPAHSAAVIPLEDNHILWKYPI